MTTRPVPNPSKPTRAPQPSARPTAARKRARAGAAADRRTRAELLAALAERETQLREAGRKLHDAHELEKVLRQRSEREAQWAADDRAHRAKADRERTETLRALLVHLATTHKHVLDARFRLPMAADNGGAADALQLARQETEAALALPNLSQLLAEAGLGAHWTAILGVGALAMSAMWYLIGRATKPAPSPAGPRTATGIGMGGVAPAAAGGAVPTVPPAPTGAPAP